MKYESILREMEKVEFMLENPDLKNIERRCLESYKLDLKDEWKKTRRKEGI